MENLLDLDLATECDLIVAKDRTLNSSITCTYLDVTGGTQYFDFGTYTGATLTVKNIAGTVLLLFSTTDSSILLQGSGVFKLVKTSSQMDVVRAGCYVYDMILSNPTFPKRAFLRGEITFVQNITN